MNEFDINPSEPFWEAVWGSEVLRRMIGQFDGLMFDWLSQAVLLYLREVEPELLEHFAAFVHVARWVPDRGRVDAQALLVHQLEPFLDGGMRAIVTAILLAKIALIEGKQSNYNGSLLSVLRLLGERSAFSRGGLDVLRRAYLEVMGRENTTPDQRANPPA